MEHSPKINRQPLQLAAIILIMILALAACTSGAQTPTLDVQNQVATIVAATQSALPSLPPTQAPPEPTATSAPQKVTLLLAPELQTILQLPESKLILYTISEEGIATQQQQVAGGAGQTQFELELAPGVYQFAAVYAPMEGFDLLSIWAADSSPLLVQVGDGQPAAPLTLTRPSTPCAEPAKLAAERLSLGAAYAQINSCPTGRIVYSFEASVQNPPSAAVYAISEGMFSGTFVQDIAQTASGTQFTLDVPPGEYFITARSTTADDPRFFGVWGAGGLALVKVGHYDTTNVYLAAPGDPCLAMYQLAATPDGRFPETQAYHSQLNCSGTTSTPTSGEVMGEAQMGRSPDGSDSFNESWMWSPYEDDQYQFEIKDGYMKMEGKQTKLMDAWITTPVKLKNFYLEGTFKVDGTCSDWDRYGLLVRAPVSAYGYVFSFTCGGRFRLYYMENGKTYTAIQEWKASDAIVKGSNATNRMGVWMDGKTIRLYANGKLLGEYTDQTFSEGIIGVHLGAAETLGLEVRVDELKWWDLDK